MLPNEQVASDHRYRIAIIYDTSARPDTTGEHCRRALEKLGHLVSHYSPRESTIPPIYDLYFRVDDDGEWVRPAGIGPVVVWLIDTHRDYDRRVAWAREADVVFCAQQNGATRMQAEGVNTYWLPLACDPQFHHPIPATAKIHDLCFVGNSFPGDGDRSRLLAMLQARYPGMFVGRAYGGDMARLYSASRIVFNCAIRDDVNMRVFEAAACGSLLVTNDLRDNGQNLLFTPGEHLVTYSSDEELVRAIDFYIGADEERERIAEAGMKQAHGRHTYAIRMRELVSLAMRAADRGSKRVTTQQVPAPTIPPYVDPEMDTVSTADARPRCIESGGAPVATIVIPVFNRLDMTQQCVSALRRHTDVPYEIIVVDNGSTDGSGAWAIREGLRVVSNMENRGFPAACNQGMLAGRDSQYIVLLNNDVIVPPGWLSRLISHAEKDSRVGLVGPSTNFACSRQQVETEYSSFEEFLAFAEQVAATANGQATEVVRLIGLCLLIPRRILQQVGLLDERFGIGMYEDDDYSVRARVAGYRLLWARDVFVHHAGHQTFATLPDGEYRARLEENRRRFIAKWNVAPHLAAWRNELQAISGTPPMTTPWDLLQNQRYAEAYDLFEAQVRQSPSDLNAMYGLGLAAEGRGAPKAAQHAYQMILAQAPDHQDAQRGMKRIAVMYTGAADTNGGNGHGPKTARAPVGYFEHARPEVAALVPRDARRILDIGCASGQFGALLKTRSACEVIGIEVNPVAAERARGRLDSVLVGDVEVMSLPFAEHHFDCIVCADVLEHLRDPNAILKKIRGLLSPTGVLIISIPNVQFIQMLHDAARGYWTYVPAGILDQTHLRFFTCNEIQRLLQATGFSLEHCQPIIPNDLAIQGQRTAGQYVDIVTDRIRVLAVAPGELDAFLAVQFLIVAHPSPVVIEPPGTDSPFKVSLVPISHPGDAQHHREAPSAWELLQSARYSDAYELFEQLLRESPGDLNAMLGLGLAAEGRGATAAAAMAYRFVLERRPDHSEALTALMRVRQSEAAYLATQHAR